ncbi:MAG: PEP-CTERM sorting domain-containing protein [Gemmatimonadetes bacterium]|nr:PEP-CTERM sorting domain-containing protein [Gemmatimonadota bacterium]
MLRRSLATSLLAAAVLAPTFAPTTVDAQSITYTAGAFPDAQWTETIRGLSAPVTFTRTPLTTGGNPGDMFRLDVAIAATTGANTFNVAWINSGFVFNPAVDGTFTGVSFSMDVIGLATAGFSAPFYGFIGASMQQNGVFFQASTPLSVASTQWSTLQFNWLATDTWTASVPGTQPDFSATGAPITFGFRSGFSTNCPNVNGCSAARASLGLDNYAVTISSTRVVPEPSTWALSAAGLLAIGGAARRRRRTAA